jgi:hypothetical protein
MTNVPRFKAGVCTEGLPDLEIIVNKQIMILRFE